MELARAYEHLANLRRDLYMKLGKYFAEHYDAVVMEDIHVKQLPGRCLRHDAYSNKVPSGEVWEEGGFCGS